MLYLNRELCALEITRLGLNEGEAEIDDAETWEAQYLLQLICKLYFSREMFIFSCIRKIINFNVFKESGDD